MKSRELDAFRPGVSSSSVGLVGALWPLVASCPFILAFLSLHTFERWTKSFEVKSRELDVFRPGVSNSSFGLVGALWPLVASCPFILAFLSLHVL